MRQLCLIYFAVKYDPSGRCLSSLVQFGVELPHTFIASASKMDLHFHAMTFGEDVGDAHDVKMSLMRHHATNEQ
ncbi:hypothetical protein A0J57_23475 [Sphingobium sp. 22B]|nr:hypothetical protein AXW74_22180 [Sphingobium sp. AM]KYC29879.1 hypothetical protein A0J57_23475 [Sphingobium sp. 22B]OAP31562.1 hypothetical protein A8O16_13285 [Sphingobium sp. 20006FA]